MNNKNVCPTVPPLYTRDSGTSDTERDNSWDKPGTKSLKALALASLAVPFDRDKVGHGVGQAQKSCPTPTYPLGTKKERVPLADDPTPEQLAHMQRLLVDCPNTPGTKWHCWYCSRCPKAAACSAWRHLAMEVKMFRLSGPPYSLYLAEESKAVLQ